MIITIISIIIFTVIVWGINKILPIKICPICAGVSLTWLWMILGMVYGLLSIEKYQLITAVLMGGSVIGITNKLQDKYKTLKERKILVQDEENKKVEASKNRLDDCC